MPRIEINLRQDSDAFTLRGHNDETARILRQLADELDDYNSGTCTALAEGGVAELHDYDGKSVGEIVQIRDAGTVLAWKYKLEECGCCSMWHTPDFQGDCHNDAERFTPESYAEKHGISVNDIELVYLGEEQYTVVTTESHPMECTYHISADSSEHAIALVMEGDLVPDHSEPIDLKSPRRQVHAVHELDDFLVERWFFSESEMRKVVEGDINTLSGSDECFFTDIDWTGENGSQGVSGLAVCRDGRSPVRYVDSSDGDDINPKILVEAQRILASEDAVSCVGWEPDVTKLVFRFPVLLDKDTGELVRVLCGRTFEFPPQKGDYVQLLDNAGVPCEHFELVYWTREKKPNNLWLVKTLTATDYVVKRCPEHDTEQRRGWVQVR